MVEPGEKIHVLTRRRFEDDIRRHFVGEVHIATGAIARVQGYSFVYDTNRNTFVRSPELRTRIFDLSDAGHVVHVLDEEIKLEALTYVINASDQLVLTDGAGLTLTIVEVSFLR